MRVRIARPTRFRQGTKRGGRARRLHIMPCRATGRRPMHLAAIWELVRDTAKEWWDDNAPRLGAALAFYTLLSLAPLLVVVTAMAGLVLGKAAAEGRLVTEIQDLVGPQGAQAIQTLLVNAQEPTTGVLATLVSVVVLLAGATGVFSALQDALNIVWEVEAQRPSGVWAAIKDRFFSFV